MVHNAVNQILKENLDKNMSTIVNFNDYFEYENPVVVVT